jgi:transcriptional regulator of met regulon
MTDLSVFKTDIAGSWLTVTHPVTGSTLETAEGKPVRIRVVSLLHNEREKKRLNNRKYFQTAEELQEGLLKLLAAATLEFDNLEYNGELLKATSENAYKIYKELPWLREQVERFIEEWSSFLPKA